MNFNDLNAILDAIGGFVMGMLHDVPGAAATWGACRDWILATAGLSLASTAWTLLRRRAS